MLKIYLDFFINCAKSRKKKHSTFTQNFAIKVINHLKNAKKNINFEQKRQDFLKNPKKITIQELGAGSRLKKSNIRKISYIARTSLTAPKYCILLKQIIEIYKPRKILELGTSLGIATLYMASASHKPQVITVEGATEIANLARKNFAENNLNITLIESDFDTFFTQNTDIFDMIFIDGNHTFDATLRYFDAVKKLNNNIIIVFDDIRWSKQMFAAWKKITSYPKTVSIDLFRMGIVFLSDNFDKNEKGCFIIN